MGGLSLRRVTGLLLRRLVLLLLVTLRGARVRLLVLRLALGLLVLLAVSRMAVLLRVGLLLGILTGLLVLLWHRLLVRLLVGALLGLLVLRRLGHGRVLRRAVRVEGPPATALSTESARPYPDGRIRRGVYGDSSNEGDRRPLPGTAPSGRVRTHRDPAVVEADQEFVVLLDLAGGGHDGLVRALDDRVAAFERRGGGERHQAPARVRQIV